ncbi:putative Xenobiotic-transporting ATPase [Desulfamplus magnetovallimortis]|uniref:Putative Xenobiotic-transporting ATPase n=1 Tax=Desulfamplus magnetovallimortis TaxID=1246637 RepID=A0A1W1HHX6_9BACT|nr:ABC transporter ATP-binding protein [Desulfamplus magnetovallimortis]SLM32111.1 putative Xenobiotic-transporting ATPase [Desulfamplus magnetovallimortis]
MGAYQKRTKLFFDRDSLKFLWSYARAYRINLILAFITSLILAAMGGVLAWMLNKLVKDLSISMTLETVLFWAFIALLLMLIKGILTVVNRYIMTRIHISIAHDMRVNLFEKVIQSPISFHNASKTGHLSNSLLNDVKFASAGVIELFLALWQIPATLLFLTVTMFYFNPLIASTVCILFPFLSIFVSRISRLSRKAEFHYMESQARLQGFIVEALINIRQIKYLTMLRNQVNELNKKGKSMIDARMRATLLNAIAAPISDLLSTTSICVMVILAYNQLQNGSTTPEDIAGCLAAGVGLMKPLKSMSNSMIMMQQSFAAIKRILRLHSFCIDVNKNPVELPEKIETIKFEGVNFTFDGRHNIFKDLNIAFKTGEIVGIAGKSGSGKTTLLNLLTGFYPCSAGKILIQGIDLNELNMEEWFSKIGIVSQDAQLFDDTILNNILHGNANATPEEIEHAIRCSGCEEMIKRFPSGNQTVVGESGCFLSGGEKKRVAIARALIRPLAVLILDEATSELDMKTERAILSDILKMKNNLIVIIISHRPEIFQYCHHVLIFENGNVNLMSPENAQVLVKAKN